MWRRPEATVGRLAPEMLPEQHNDDPTVSLKSRGDVTKRDLLSYIEYQTCPIFAFLHRDL